MDNQCWWVIITFTFHIYIIDLIISLVFLISLLLLKRSVKNYCSLFIRTSLQVLQKAHIKTVAHAIYTYIFFFSYIYTLLFCWKIKSCCDRCFPQQIGPQTTVQWYILRDYSSVRIGFNMINKCHTLPIVYRIYRNNWKTWFWDFNNSTNF